MKKPYLYILALIFISTVGISAQGNKPFGFDDIMKFKSIRYTTVSDKGDWVAYSAVPDRGDGVAYFHNLNDTSIIESIERGVHSQISSNSQWGASVVLPKSIEIENAKKDKPDNSLKIINLKNDKNYFVEKISKFNFSNDSKWIIIEKIADKDAYKDDKVKQKPQGSELILKHLNSGTDISMDFVSEYHLDSNSKYLFYTISEPEGKLDGLYYRNLTEDFAPEYVIDTSENASYANIAWNLKKDILAYTSGKLSGKGYPDSLTVKLWNMNSHSFRPIISEDAIQEGWYMPYKNKFEWTDDGERLYLGVKPNWEKDTTDKDDFKYNDSTFYDVDAILSQNDLLVWHWDDPLISTNQVKWWQSNKDRTYLCVYHLASDSFVQLADEKVDNVVATDNPDYTIGYDANPYKKEITWNGWFFDLYAVNLKTAEKKLIQTRVMESAHISPLGKYIAYFKDLDWHIYDTAADSSINVTAKINVNFFNEDNDVPQAAGSYGFGGWYSKDEGFITYDKYDIWAIGTNNKSYNNLTYVEGRVHKKRIRITNLDKDKKYYSYGDSMYTTSYYFESRKQGLSKTNIGVAGSLELIDKEGKKFSWVAKAKDADVFIYTRESFDEFPDLWVSYTHIFDSVSKVSNVNPQMQEYKWGYTSPFEFVTPRNDTLKGYTIKPDDFDPNKKYPLLVYFYEQFAEYTYEFYQPRINHRPNYHSYLSDGYLVMVPDIKYYTGRPGYDATDAVVAATNHILDSGFVDPDKIVIQGHSWGAYEAAFIITQTDMFAASCVGAPVGNMTSAYSGIRHGTGLARQFQYEQYQSRIGGNLWDSLDSYLNNSPVFLAEKINTPLLIMHGDVDDAVPWEQSIELYLALRRLEKPVWLLQYKGEPHHPRKYPNKVDWAVKMKEFFDHYALGKPAPLWLEEGKPWWGE